MKHKRISSLFLTSLFIMTLILFMHGRTFSALTTSAESDFTFSNGTITGYTGTDTVINIPKTINGELVTSIGTNAFSGKHLTSVTIPDSVTNIGDAAFYVNKLTTVVIPNSVTTIGLMAFCNNELTSALISNNVTSIGNSSFQSNKLTTVVIPNSVINIGDSAFYCNQLTSVTISNSVKTIGGTAFGTNRLTSVTIPDNVTSIGDYAFMYNQLTKVIMGNSVKSIGVSAFYGNQLTSLSIPKSTKSIGDTAFDLNNLTSITIGNDVDASACAISPSFGSAYDNGGRQAGTYTSDSQTGTWKKLVENVTEVTVRNVTSVSLDKISIDLKVGQKEQITATTLTDNNSNTDVIWSVYSGSKVASVSRTGLVTGLNPGTAIIRATNKHEISEYTKCIINVTAPEISQEKMIKLRIIVDGKVKELDAQAITKGDFYFLPVSKLLPYFDVKKNKINFNQKDKSCKIIYGKKIIKLKVGDKKVYVNDKLINLRAPVIFSNGNLYISTDFWSVFEKNSFFDNSTGYILITSSTNYKLVKDTVEKLAKRISQIKKYKLEMNNYDLLIYDGSEDLKKEKTIIQMDVKSGTMYGTSKSSEGLQERYYSNGYMYYKDESTEGNWEKFLLDHPFMDEFLGFSDLYSESPSFYAGLNYTFNKKSKETKLSGMGYSEIVKRYIFMIEGKDINSVDLTEYTYDIVLDQDTYNIKSIKLHIKGKNKPNTTSYSFDKKLELKFNGINGNYVIPTPKGIENAVIAEG